MTCGARRHPSRLWTTSVRRVGLVLSLWLAGAAAGVAAGATCENAPTSQDGFVAGSHVGEGRVEAGYANLTRRYGHGILGDALEPETLVVKDPARASCGARLTLDANHVFEDIAPRLVDLDGDGNPEIITIRTHLSKGAQIAVYGLNNARLRLRATTPYIGRTHRWLAPVGAADLDGDGFVEIAYIDRPHLARTLRIWRYRGGRLEHVADKPGLTNHRIGETFISGGIRQCGRGPEMVTVDKNWSRVMISQLDKGRITSRDAGPFRGQNSLKAALACQ